MPALSTHLPRGNRPGRTSSDAMHQQSDNSNSANPPSDSPTLTPGINCITPTIIETTSQYSSPVTPTTASPPLPPPQSPPPPAKGTLSLTDINATAHSHHHLHHQRWGLSPKLSSMRPHIHFTHPAWSVTCESIVQRLVNQCLEHQHAAEIAAVTAITVLAH
ncbi:unnamed protein product [Schistocephalus solidus]|uniref:Uncharacterized protein n=1 Tax=Schistocephalus solidus TaxID=70667 RepID=A0A183SPY0_SCHSO|nr:unnamed protein product [Schistocephalus solidus]